MNLQIPSLLTLAALLPGALLAQSDTATEAEALPRYDVEIVIFKNIKVPKSREFVLPVSSPNRDDNLLDLSSPKSIAAARELDFEVLPGDQFRLLEVVTRLVESPRYELLLHVAWRQPGLDRDKALPVWIKGGRIYGNEFTSIDSQIEFFESNLQAGGSEAADASYEFDEQSLEALELQMLEKEAQKPHGGLYELEGKITIALSRYLHAYTDLVLRRPRLSIDPVLSNPIQDQYLIDNAADTRILNNHSLREHRRMRSRNLHYLDNPEFSMLILITPYEAPEIDAIPSEEESADAATQG